MHGTIHDVDESQIGHWISGRVGLPQLHHSSQSHVTTLPSLIEPAVCHASQQLRIKQGQGEQQREAEETPTMVRCSKQCQTMLRRRIIKSPFCVVR